MRHKIVSSVLSYQYKRSNLLTLIINFPRYQHSHFVGIFVLISE